MKYYLVHIPTQADGTQAISTFAYDNRDEAEIAFHRELAYDMDVDTVVSTLVMVINDAGNTEMCRKWSAPVEE